MKKTTLLFTVAIIAASLLHAMPAQAQNNRSFVSGSGVDTNSCSLTAPCRTFAGAISKTNAGGEIAILDTAGYGAVTITKAISIVNPGGVEAGISVASGGTAITISGGTNDAIRLRGLTINGGGAGLVGIQFNSGQSLTIENCDLSNFVDGGIVFTPSAPSGLSVSDTHADHMVFNGIFVGPIGAAGTVTVVLNRVEASFNGKDGIFVQGGAATGAINATVSNSVADGNISVGFEAESASGHATSNLTVFHSVASNNGAGIGAGNGATISIAQSSVSGNGGGWFAGSGIVQSYGDNYFNNNGSNVGSLTPVSKQ